MKKSYLRLAAVLGALVLGSSLAACSADTDGGGAGGGDAAESGVIAFLMPDLASTRYEEQDAPLFTAKVAELCPECEVIYQNADSDPAKQQQQAESAITQGAKAIVLDAVDTKAAATIVTSAQAAGIPVITYDRPITTAPADFYVSFDNEEIGNLIATSLVEKLDADGAEGGVLIVNGSPTDDAAQLIKAGMNAGVEGSAYEILAQFDTPKWDPQQAQDWVSGQITQFDDIVGVVAANDGTGGGTIAAFQAAGITPIPPVTGNDAELAAIQRIIAGTQYNTISKPIATVAEAAAEVAVQLIRGETPSADTELFDTPSQLFTPTVVTADNVKEIIFDGGIYTAAQACTGEFAARCAELGIE
ncbi:substrate-binding domain-containing protein [Microbacterium sp.]|uniref:substrate-binding domain-containing protein n=1 Tax=Microbacterium sp. TaxID=51671 RepID=UPI003F6E7498